MNVNYILNTCDLEDWEYGEQSVAYIDDKILYVADYSDGYIDITDSRRVQKEIQDQLNTQEEISFVRVSNPSKKVLKAIRKYIGC